ncbi:MAG: hypothetical protein ACTHJS_01385 [Xanthobacteraceae bacterium]
MSIDYVPLLFFAVGNAFRIAAYFPQIVRILRDESGARAISCCTWTMFAIANLSTVTYAALVLGDRYVTSVFLVNFCCCAGIVIVTLQRRRATVCATVEVRDAAR